MSSSTSQGMTDEPMAVGLALPPANVAALELRMAVVETGSALPDFDKSKA